MTDDPVDLTSCDREPIHQLGRVQSYGALVAVSHDWIVQHASENLAAVLGVPAERALGAHLGDLIVSDTLARIRESLAGLHGETSVIRLFRVPVRAGGRDVDISIHESGRHLIVEFEPKSASRAQDLVGEVYPLIAALRGKRDLAELACAAADTLRRLSGFDSVMVYRFDEDHSGEVIAESRADGERVYLGLHFPASDIPSQARALYSRALLRLIADVNDPGAGIVPPQAQTGRPLDLSLAVTRAVSPIHLEYLRNMGIQGSMSVSIMKDGALWGLFACHHATPRHIDYERRSAVELFGHLFSYELGAFKAESRRKAEAETARLHTKLLAGMAEGATLKSALVSISRDVGRVIAHDGIALFIDDEVSASGVTPGEESIRALARQLDRRIHAAVFSCDKARDFSEAAEDFAGRCAGFLAIPISRRPRDYVILFRRPVSATVNWAGNPAKPVTAGPSGSRLTPRRSFEIWREVVEDRSARWSQFELQAAELVRTTLLEVFLKVTDAANLERKRANEQQQLLISELNHRVRNILNLIRGLVAQSRTGARTIAEFTDSLDGRIQSLARAHDQLTAEKWEPASLKHLIALEFEAYAADARDRAQVRGPDALVSPTAFTTLALVLHELATNSMKYGALGKGAGRVEIGLSFDSSQALLIDWREIGGPPVSPPKRRGFGTTILERSVPHELKGEASVDYRLTGLEARFRIPPGFVERLDEEPAAEAPAPAPAEGGALCLSGTGLVVEDSFIIAMDVADMMTRLGASSVLMAASVAEALAHVAAQPIGFAVLDVNLGDEQSVAVAERLSALGVPYVLATGYGETPALLELYPPCKVLQKPFSGEALAAALGAAGAGAGARG